MTWGAAKDRPSTEVLNEKPYITEGLVISLQRHDKYCGTLYGLLPLARGSPVALTGHVDQRPEKSVLHGRIGYIDDWVLAHAEDSVFEDGQRILRYMVRVVLVQFKEWVEEEGCSVYKPCRWTIDGVGKPGVYLTFPWERAWDIGQNRMRPVLEVKR